MSTLFLEGIDAKARKSLHHDYVAVIEWRQGADTAKKGFTQWSPFNEKTTYFAPSMKDFKINYRVEQLEALIDQCSKDSVLYVSTTGKWYLC